MIGLSQDLFPFPDFFSPNSINFSAEKRLSIPVSVCRRGVSITAKRQFLIHFGQNKKFHWLCSRFPWLSWPVTSLDETESAGNRIRDIYLRRQDRRAEVFLWWKAFLRRPGAALRDSRRCIRCSRSGGSSRWALRLPSKRRAVQLVSDSATIRLQRNHRLFRGTRDDAVPTWRAADTYVASLIASQQWAV